MVGSADPQSESLPLFPPLPALFMSQTKGLFIISGDTEKSSKERKLCAVPSPSLRDQTEFCFLRGRSVCFVRPKTVGFCFDHNFCTQSRGWGSAVFYTLIGTGAIFALLEQRKGSHSKGIVWSTIAMDHQDSTLQTVTDMWGPLWGWVCFPLLVSFTYLNSRFVHRNPPKVSHPVLSGGPQLSALVTTAQSVRRSRNPG